MFLISELIAQLTANLIFNQALGTSTIIIAAKNKKNFIGVAIIITLFTTLGSIAACFIDKIIAPEKEYWLLICYTLVIALIYIFSLVIINAISKEIFSKIKLYIHISAYNCAVMGSIYTAHNIASGSENSGLSEYVSYGLKAGMGFVIAAFMLMAAYKNLKSSKVPSSFRGFPAMLVYIGIISMALYSLK